MSPVSKTTFDMPVEPLFQKRAAVVQGKEEAPDSLGEEEESPEAEPEKGASPHLIVTHTCEPHLYYLLRLARSLL